MPPLLMFFFMSLLQSPSQLSTQSYVWKKYRKGVALIYLDLRPKKYPDQFPACEGGQSYFQCYRKNIFKCSVLLLFHKVRKKQDTLNTVWKEAASKTTTFMRSAQLGYQQATTVMGS